jgi:hypothetical protein
MGTGALSGYRTAAELYEYLRVEMPWSFPGLFDDDKYWELTAYLAEANKIDLPAEPLGPDNGGEILLVSGMMQTHDDGIGMERVLAGTMMVLFLGALAASRWPVSPTDSQQHENEPDGDR